MTGRAGCGAPFGSICLKLSILFVGALYDRGFNQCALDGAERLRASGLDLEIIGGIPFAPDAMTEALHRAAESAQGVIFIGGQGNAVTPPVAAAFPETRFAVVQGNVTAANLASYDVLQEQSAFLAGAAAARLTRSGVVGHLSGHRVVPGLKGRAAFAAGVRHVAPGMRVVTGFCGTQDDSAVTERWATGIAAESADILFTMLNAARAGAVAACGATGMRQIGNVTDWSADDPEVFVASALARIDLGVERAARDMLSGVVPGGIVHLGLAESAASLALAPDVLAEVRDEIEALAVRITRGEVTVPTTYDGPEFELTA